MSWTKREITSPLVIMLLMLALSGVGGVAVAVSWELSDWWAIAFVLVASTIGAAIFQRTVRLK